MRQSCMQSSIPALSTLYSTGEMSVYFTATLLVLVLNNAVEESSSLNPL